jgi:hypothetical protein
MALIDFVFTRAGEATRTAQNGLLATVPSNFPVVNFADGELRGYYSQRAATNLLLRSEEFDNAYWGKTNLNTTGTPPWVNVAVAPDGTTTAEKIIPNVGILGNCRRVINYSAGTKYTLSVFAKMDSDFNLIGLTVETNATVQINLLTGDSSIIAELNGWTIDNIKLEPYSNGWKRFSATFTAGSSGSFATRFAEVRNSGDGTSGIFFWGAQLEVGSEATSYIKTVDTTVTRNKDVATASDLTLSPLSNVQFKANFPTDYPLVIAGLQATVSGYRTIRLELSPTEKTLFVDGVEADTDTGSYDWSGITSIELGHFDGGEQPNFEIADLRINE